MQWNKGFSSKFYGSFIDPVSWRDIERFEITGGSIKRSDSGTNCSAEIDCTSYDQSTERWVRIWLDAEQSGSSDHVALFTGLATAPEREVEGINRSTNKVTCYSTLKPCQDVLLPLGYYAMAGVSGAKLVKDLLTEITPAPVEMEENSPALSQYIVAEDNESYLSMVEKILSAIGWKIRIHGDGTIEICSMSTTPKASFDMLENDSLEPKLKATNDWYDCPNVFRAILEDTSAVAKDESEKNPLSIPNRGREVWLEERDCNLNANETLAEYAYRRLKEEQRHYLSVSYDRRFDPNILASDVIRLHYPSIGIDGLFYVSEQSIELGYGAKTSEEVIQI